MRISDWSSDVCSSDLPRHILDGCGPVSATARHPRLERRLARLLRHGTWLACLVLAIGFALALLRPGGSGTAVMLGGIGLLILLPEIGRASGRQRVWSYV